MRATLANMRIVWDKVPNSSHHEIVAYSPRTGERCSANPGDHFLMAPDDVLRDSKGRPMLLGRIIPEHIRRID